jgi:hypothetical protein
MNAKETRGTRENTKATSGTRELTASELEQVSGGTKTTPNLMKSCVQGVHYPTVILTV